MTILEYVLWYPSPEILPDTFIPVRWYGLLFALAFVFAQMLLVHIFKAEGKPEKDVEALFITSMVATVIGARLGHVLFYEPEKYISNPLNVLKIWEGGLASHGAAFAIIIAIFIYVHYKINIGIGKFSVQKTTRKGQNFWWVIDRIVITVALGGAFIRIGNFMNSEIIGKPTESESGVVFARDAIFGLKRNNKGIEDIKFEKINKEVKDNEAGVPLEMQITFKKGPYDKAQIESYANNHLNNILHADNYITEQVKLEEGQKLDYTINQKRGQYQLSAEVMGIPRYPAQLFEAISCVVIFLMLFLIWNRKKENTPQGLLFGIFLILVFGLRFAYEFLKENQVAFEDDLALNMGQWLSIPLLLAGVIIVIVSLTRKPKNLDE